MNRAERRAQEFIINSYQTKEEGIARTFVGKMRHGVEERRRQVKEEQKTVNFRTGTFLQETPQELKNRDYFRKYHTTRPLRHSSSSPALVEAAMVGDPLLNKAFSCADLGRRPTLYEIVQEATRVTKPKGYIRKGLRDKLAARADQAREQIQRRGSHQPAARWSIGSRSGSQLYRPHRPSTASTASTHRPTSASDVDSVVASDSDSEIVVPVISPLMQEKGPLIQKKGPLPKRNVLYPKESQCIVQSDPDLPGPDIPEPRFTGRINFPRYRKLTVFHPDIPDTPIYRAKSFPPRIPVNRGPTVVPIMKADPRHSAMPCPNRANFIGLSSGLVSKTPHTLRARWQGVTSLPRGGVEHNN
eukprot:sb/3466063/